MAVAQDKGVTAQAGLSAELIVIAAVIIGGASILGGRGRVLGSFIGALLIVLINKVLREGLPITRTVMVDGERSQVQAIFTLPAGAVPAFIGMLLIVAVLIEPYIIRRQRAAAHLGVAARPAAAACRRYRRRRDRRRADQGRDGDRQGADARAASASSSRGATRWRSSSTVVLWFVGFCLRPDYWCESAQHLRDPAQLHRARAASPSA